METPHLFSNVEIETNRITSYSHSYSLGGSNYIFGSSQK